MDAEDKKDMLKINDLLSNINTVIKSGNFDKFKELIQKMHDIKNKVLLQTRFRNANVNIIGLLCEHKKKSLLSYLLHQAHILHQLASSDASQRQQHRQEAFYKAMCAHHFPILEMLYDYWTGDLHWLGHKKDYDTLDVENLNQLNTALKKAFYEYGQHCKRTQKLDCTMYLNIRSLIAFNDFQKKLYTKLDNLKLKIITWKDEHKDIVRIEETYALRNIILTILDTYNSHQNLMQGWIEGKMSKPSFYFMYEVYFCKLDSNIFLLLLDNLHLLKQRLKMPTNSYRILEDKLYEFNYHVTSKWRLYLPKKKGLHSVKVAANQEMLYKYYYDQKKYENHIYTIFLIRRDFQEAISHFGNELWNRNIENNIIKAETKMAYDDVNTVTPAPELRDDYSLRKMSRQISQLYSVDVKNDKYAFLLIERTLQIVGEFVKTKDESVHLHYTTAVTLQAELSVEVMEDMKSLRDMLCHAEKAQLLKRINFESNKTDLFESIRKELLFVKMKIDRVIDFHKPFLEYALIWNSLGILLERRHTFPEHVDRALDYLFELIALLSSRSLKRLFAKVLSALIRILKSINMEAYDLLLAIKQHEQKFFKSLAFIDKHVTMKFPFYRDVITHYLQKITDLMRHISMSQPNTNPQWKYVQKYWRFILGLMYQINHAMQPFDMQRKWVLLHEILSVLHTMHDVDRLDSHKLTIMQYLDIMQAELNINTHVTHGGTQSVLFTDLRGITELTNDLSKVNFLTADEKKYLTATLLDIIEDLNQALGNERERANRIYRMISKIKEDTPIKLREYNSFITSIALDDKGKKMLKNLAMGTKRDPLLAACLRKRVSLLRELITHQSKNQLIQRYNSDRTFRAVLEGMLFDIFDILKNINTIVRKSNKLLTEISLRNILTHGSPLLEVVGNALDADDLPAELISKALQFVEDENAIIALCMLIDSGFNFNTINSSTLAPEEEAVVVVLKSSVRWKDYLQLVPHYKQFLYEERKLNKSKIDDTLPELVQAVYKNDPAAVQEAIDRGADVNFIDGHKKAAIHHAAIKGYVQVMEVLLKNNADVNIGNGENHLTALHYSAMYGFKDSIESLLKNGADCLALDEKGRTPVYLAKQRKLEEISCILIKAMKIEDTRILGT